MTAIDESERTGADEGAEKRVWDDEMENVVADRAAVKGVEILRAANGAPGLGNNLLTLDMLIPDLASLQLGTRELSHLYTVTGREIQKRLKKTVAPGVPVKCFRILAAPWAPAFEPLREPFETGDELIVDVDVALAILSRGGDEKHACGGLYYPHTVPEACRFFEAEVIRSRPQAMKGQAVWHRKVQRLRAAEVFTQGTTDDLLDGSYDEVARLPAEDRAFMQTAVEEGNRRALEREAVEPGDAAETA
ncbi:MAG: hypothetical protein WB974_09400 [Acidobacteriaceae bacterium]